MPPGPGRRRLARAVLAGVLLALLVVVGVALWLRATAPRPPAVALAGVDPQIALVIRDAEDGVRRSPRSGPSWGYLGQVLFAHEYQAQAEVCFADASRFDPAEPRWPYLRGVCLLLQEPDPNRALPDLRRAAALAGDTPDAPRLKLAETLIDLNRTDEAESLLRRALQSNPGNARALLAQGRIEMAQGNTEAARADLNASYQIAPEIKATQILLVQILRQQGDPRAPALLKQAARLSDTPNWPDPFLSEALQLKVGRIADINQATNLLNAGQFGPVVTLMQPDAQRYPDSADVWRLLGSGAVGEGNVTGGEADLRHALALDPNSAQTNIHLGDVLARQNRYAEAKPFFLKTLALQPDFPEAHLDVGVCLLHENNPSGAAQQFRTTVQTEPSNIHAYFCLATALAQEGKTAAAVQALQTAHQKSPQDAPVNGLLARLQKHS